MDSWFLHFDWIKWLMSAGGPGNRSQEAMNMSGAKFGSVLSGIRSLRFQLSAFQIGRVTHLSLRTGTAFPTAFRFLTSWLPAKKIPASAQ